MLELSRIFVDTLNSHGIEYCHWKENNELEKSLSGEEDLDLLVSRQDYDRFLEIILSLGFKEAYHRKYRFPFIFHFYGLDRETGTFLHLHVHLNIITGESHTKNYHLPMEKMILENSVFHSSGCRIPCPEVELIIFIVRYYIKISCLPGALLIWKKRSSFNIEFSHINSTIDPDKVNSLLKTYIKSIPIGFFNEMLDGYVSSTRLSRKVYLGIQERQLLSSFSRNGITRSFISRYAHIVHRFIGKFVTGEKKCLVSGGAIIAITGLDATGKSTITGELHQWLRKDFMTRYLHVGRPRPRLETVWVRPLLMMRKLFKVKLQTITTTSHEDSIEPCSMDINEYGLAYAIRWLIAGYERYQLLKYANRLRARGYIVVCDRYPSLNEGKMDSPRIGDMHETGNLIGMMGRIEAMLYNAMPVPDAIFNLSIPFDVALQRNRSRVKYGKETDAQLHKRYIDNSGLLYEARYFETIDASQDLQTLLRELRRKAWALL
ncbi:MAG: hypothetical protein JSW20_06800 [Nitrospiraceae bacterium]|nr:MAG: hypothetical protein JSW20_06800 [Nitrospiraceae bacterium]